MKGLVKECLVVDGMIQYKYELTLDGDDYNARGDVALDTNTFMDGSMYTVHFNSCWDKTQKEIYTILRYELFLDEDGVIWQQIYTLTSNKIPQEAIDIYNHRLSLMEAEKSQ